MRAFRIDSHDSTATLQDIPAPHPGNGEIAVRISACGLNFADLLMLKGEYQDTPDTPFTLGMEVAGTVEALGEGVDGPAVGSRVAVFGGQGGAVLIERFRGWRVGIVTSDGGLAKATGLDLNAGPPVPHGGLSVKLYQARL